MFDNSLIQQQHQQRQRQRRRGLPEDPSGSFNRGRPLPQQQEPPFSHNLRSSSSNNNHNKPPRAMPCLTSSVSGPSVLSRSHDFASDVSVLSCASAQEAKAWFCVNCSYRNSDMYQTTCALCGCARCITGATNQSISSCASVSSNNTTTTGGKQTIFTIDSNISLFGNQSIRSAASRTTGTGASHSTKVVSNCSNLFLRRPSNDHQQNITSCAKIARGPLRRPSTDHHNTSCAVIARGPLRRPRCEDEEEDGCAQPPNHHHHNSNTALDAVSSSDDDESDDDDYDDVSIASQDTCRMGSLSSSSCSNSVEANDSHSSGSEDSVDDSLDSQKSRRKVVPHDEPTEMQPRHVRRRPRQLPQASSPVKPLRQDAIVVATTTATTEPVKKSSSTHKKKSIKDFIPGLRRRRRSSNRSNATTSTAALSLASGSSGGSIKSKFSSLETLSSHVLPHHDEQASCSTHDEEDDDDSDAFHNSCGRSDWCQAGSVRRPGLHPLMPTARYGENYY
ncbi:expressed unknown protein [Seminavis robusta]|uniref:Uncharacterized protein n=1 Tax=Seminavis robusta TaxID=568900 RepID=A0A9N8E5Y0_9STRA|nr:expressed unknown protein [Seminavis robusta]|eukprot:Sro583_g170700.1 n/a (505) ;mRNA; r:45756-47270